MPSSKRSTTRLPLTTISRQFIYRVIYKAQMCAIPDIYYTFVRPKHSVLFCFQSAVFLVKSSGFSLDVVLKTCTCVICV